MYEPIFSGPAGDWLAVIGLLSCVYWAWRALAALIRYAQDSPTGPPTRAPAALHSRTIAEGPTLADDLPVIAAAVAAMMDTHRIIRIEEAPHGQVWSAQGRWLHQTSHRPH